MGSEVQILSGAMLTSLPIIEIFSIGPFETNAIVLGCPRTKRAAIIDLPAESVPILSKVLDQYQFTLEMLLITHSHWDHIADAANAKKMWNVPLYIHPEDAPNLENPGADQLPLLFPIEGVKADRFLSDGQELRLGDLLIAVIHTPGHTPGGVCFWLRQEKILISGDTLFKGTIGNLSFPTARPNLMWESLRKLASLPPETKVFPGHGEETTIGAEQWIIDAEKYFQGPL